MLQRKANKNYENLSEEEKIESVDKLGSYTESVLQQMNLVKKKKSQNARNLNNDISKERKGKRIECGREKYRNLSKEEKIKRHQYLFLEVQNIILAQKKWLFQANMRNLFRAFVLKYKIFLGYNNIRIFLDKNICIFMNGF